MLPSLVELGHSGVPAPQIGSLHASIVCVRVGSLAFVRRRGVVEHPATTAMTATVAIGMPRPIGR